MIYQVRGILREKVPGTKEREPGLAVVEVGGLGLGLWVSTPTFAALPPVGEEVFLWTHLEVREDEWVLVGFSSREEKAMYRVLRGIGGIGYRLALSLLGLGVGELQEAARTGSLSLLEKVPGIGRKTAQRVLWELQQKTLPGSPAFSTGGEGEGPLPDALAALLALGYTASEAGRALEVVRQRGGAGESPEAWVKEALRVLGGSR